MTGTTAGAPVPKKRSFFKRAAWQDAPKEQDDDIFSHKKDFKHMVAEQNKREEEARHKKTEQERKRKEDEQHDRKRRKVSSESSAPRSGSGSSARTSRTSNKARSRTPLSPGSSPPLPDSLCARYDSLTKSSSTLEMSRKQSVIIDLGSSDVEDDDTSREPTPKSKISLRPAKSVPSEDDELAEVEDPALAALAARARARAAASAKAATTWANGAAPVIQLFISPEIPDAKPLMVKVRIDSTLEKTRLAWCGKQDYTPEMTEVVFFTHLGQRVYDSTTVKRLGINVHDNGSISVENDTNIYDDVNLPKIYVEAWTPELYQQRKTEDAAEVEAKKKAAEPPPDIDERSPTPEPTPKAIKVRLIMKARGKEDFKLSVNPDTTIGHIAHAYKSSRNVEASQPITLMFDGQRLAPMDTVDDAEIEDMDSIEVVFK